MAKTNEELRDKMAQVPAIAPQASVSTQVNQYLERMKPEMLRALPKHLTPERMVRVTLTSIRLNPRLGECGIESLCGSMMEAAQLGLEPGILGECHLVPFRNGRTGQYEAKLIKGFQGLIKLVRQTGELVSINADVIHANDEFSYVRGYEENLEHKPNFKNPGDVVGFYAYALLKDGGRQSTVMSKEQVDKIRARSKAKDDGPWVTDYEEMGKKTALKRLCKYLPMSVVAREAIEEDDRREFGPEPVEINLGDVSRIELKPEPPAAVPTPAEQPQQVPKKAVSRAKAPEPVATPVPDPKALLAYEIEQGEHQGRMIGELSPAQCKWILNRNESGEAPISAQDKEKLLDYCAKFPDA